MKGLLKRALKALGKFILRRAVDEVVKGRQEGRWEQDARPAPPQGRTMDPR